MDKIVRVCMWVDDSNLKIIRSHFLPVPEFDTNSLYILCNYCHLISKVQIKWTMANRIFKHFLDNQNNHMKYLYIFCRCYIHGTLCLKRISHWELGLKTCQKIPYWSIIYNIDNSMHLFGICKTNIHSTTYSVEEEKNLL